MSLETRLISLATAIGNDIKALKNTDGSLSSLNTTNKNNLVSAINEIFALVQSTGQGVDINDSAGNGDTTVTWSADKIYDTIEAAKAAVKSDLVNGSGAALDTLKELADALGNDPSFATTIATELSNRVRFDSAQTLTNTQKAQARDNIGAAASSDVTGAVKFDAAQTLTSMQQAQARSNIGAVSLNAIGDTEHDFVSDYNVAKT